MIKIYLAILCLLGCAGTATAAQRSNTPDIVAISTPLIIGVSKTSWTLVDRATASFSDATGMIIDYAEANLSGAMFEFSTGTLAPATTFFGYEFPITDPPLYLNVDKSINVWFIATATPTQLIKHEYK